MNMKLNQMVGEKRMNLNKIHEDNRGSINILDGLYKYPEVTVFQTNAGFARGGCIHNENDEYCVVIEGEILYSIGDLNNPKKLKVGESVIIPKSTPHYFLSLTNSTVLEWGATPEEKKVKHPFYRQIVEYINKESK
jgi:mannose-6-phosphate isomerase-like protein (cupin superfamily)